MTPSNGDGRLNVLLMVSPAGDGALENGNRDDHCSDEEPGQQEPASAGIELHEWHIAGVFTRTGNLEGARTVKLIVRVILAPALVWIALRPVKRIRSRPLR